MSLNYPRQPSRVGPDYEYLRQSARHNQSRGATATATGGTMGPWGFIPNRRKIRFPKVSGEVEQFRIVHVRKDYVTGYRITLNDDQSVASEDTSNLVRIAKPYELRATPWDGETINGATYTYFPHEDDGGLLFPDDVQNPYYGRTVSWDPAELRIYGVNGSTTVPFTEHVYPPYHGGVSIIYAAKVKQKPVFKTTETNIVDGSPVAETFNVDWIDLNVDGRAFLPDWRAVRLCFRDDNGTVTSQGDVLFRSSGPFNVT